MNTVQRLSRIRLMCREPEGLGCFYEQAFGFVRSEQSKMGGTALESLLRIPGAEATVIRMELGEQTIELVGIKPEAQAYPPEVPAWSTLFQHFAIVVSDMAAAYATLSAQKGWHPISVAGPQVLPASSGGVAAFKFQDPEGHPLELLAFPSNAAPEIWEKSRANGCLGIDHSAISVADTSRSASFYRGLGLHRSGGSHNTGPAQDKLDNIKGAVVEVTALAPPDPTPHVELLCYQGTFNRNFRLPSINGAAATQLILTVESTSALDVLCAQNPDALYSGPIAFEDGVARAMMCDPDGHLLCLEAPL
jgi:catechol 2,3-dioxygenase-like lactoylglutathione lyase family enzyme